MTESPAVTRVLIVDDHAVVRTGLRALLDCAPDFEVVGEARTGREAVTRAAELSPDLVLMDLLMPDMGGAEATARITSADPDVTVVVLSSFVSDDQLIPAIRAGAAGYLLKDGEPEDLLRGLREAVGGGTPLAPAAARRLMAEAARSEERVGPEVDPLSEREVEVLKTLTLGLSNRDIADRLCISEATTRSHVSHILAKLGLSSRTQAALYALRTGLVSVDELE
jgi:DNA-binding NarL/FixJ family response regulator